MTAMLSDVKDLISHAFNAWNIHGISGVVCGALVFLLHSREPSWWRKALYFVVSLIGGFALTPSLQRQWLWLPEWPAAFLSAAAIVTLATILLDWSERTIPTLLTEFVHRLIGGNGVRDPTQPSTKDKST